MSDQTFVADPGPAFDPSKAAPAPEPERAQLHALPEPMELWDEERVRRGLVAKGQLVHAVVGVGEADWLYTEQDLKAIAAPLASILNRYDMTRAAAGVSDELAVAVGFGGYAARSVRERAAVLRALAEQPEVPVSGYAAEPGTGPPSPSEAEHQAAPVDVDAEEVSWHRA